MYLFYNRKRSYDFFKFMNAMNILSGQELQVNTFLNGLSFPHTYLFYLL